MDIAEFFISQTRPIQYSKMPIDSWSIKEDRWIELSNPPPIPHFYDKDLSHTQLSEMSRKHYESNYIGILTDNSCLIHYLTIIEEYYQNEGATFPYDLYALGHFRHNNLTSRVRGIVEDIYGTFLCFKYLIWEDEKAFDTLLTKIIIPWNRAHNNEEDALYQIPVDGNPEISCWYYLHESSLWFGEGSNSIQYSLRVDYGKVEEYIIASTLGDALLYQLFMHISMGKEGIYRKYKLAICEMCHSQFMKKHGNSRFCETCARNDVRVAAHRSKKKGVAQHAQETHP